MSMTAWGLAAALAGIAGILLAPKLLITPDMGVIVILALAAAIIGGFVSLPGCVAGGIVLGVVQNLIGLYVSLARHFAGAVPRHHDRAAGAAAGPVRRQSRRQEGVTCTARRPSPDWRRWRCC